MKRTLTLAAVVVGVGLLAVRPLVAHHSFTSEFDNSKPVTVKGRVTKMEWVNPHSWVHFDVTGADGKVVNWGAETPPTNVLFRNGWKKDSLKIGDEIQVQGFAAKDGTPTGFLNKLYFPDGRVFVLANKDPYAR